MWRLGAIIDIWCLLTQIETDFEAITENEKRSCTTTWCYPVSAGGF
jgi:hypothetical protein